MNQQTNCPLPITTGGLRRQPKTPTRDNKQSRPPLPPTRLRPRNRRQPRSHGPSGPTVRQHNKPGNSTGRHPPVPKGPRTNPIRMGKETPTNENTGGMVQGPQTRCRGRQRSKEGGNTPHSHLRHRQTPRNCQNPHPTKQKLLVARDEELCHPIHRRMRPLPVMQKYHYTTKTSPIPYRDKPGSATIQMYSARFHH